MYLTKDIENPDRGLCSIGGCDHLQRNHGTSGNKRWGKLCEKHHTDPVMRVERVAAQNRHRMLLKAEKAARAIEYRRNQRVGKVYPMACTKCGQVKSREEYPTGKGRTCRVCCADRARNYMLKKNYGIGASGYKSLLVQQNGVCAICGNEPTVGKKLSVDHCHTTDDVRGLLCDKCNFALGLFNDDLDLLASASSYLINSRLRKIG